MPSAPLIASLPVGVRDQLDERLVAQHFGGIVETTEWLRGLGHVLGKSTVGAYSLQLKRRTEAERLFSAPNGPEMALTKLRLECATIAALSGAGANVLARADEIFDWAVAPPG